MKKRLLSALLALALVFVLLPTTALADTTPVTDENVKINGTAVIVGNDISLGEGNGTYSYDEATHTLTLNSATINATGSNIGISFGVPVKGNINYRIELEGKNTITSTSAQAIYVEHDTSVEAWEKDTMKRSTLTINGSAGSSLNLSVSGSKEAIEAIWSKGDFTLSGGTAVTAFSSGTIAVNVGSMTINNSKLSAQSSSYGTTVVLYGFEMIGDAAEFEALNTSSSVRAVLRTSGASENIDWSNYQFTTGSYSGNALTKSEPTVCDKNTLNELFSSSSTTRYIHIAKRTIPALQRTSDVLIAKENAVVGQWTNIPADTGTGSYSYDADKKELTLKDVNITSGINAIQFMANGAYTIKLEGENKISNVSNGISLSDDQYITSLNVTITGTGSLDISAKGLAINMKKGDLKFENTGAIKLATGNIGLNNNALSVKGNITITDMSKYSVTGTQQTGGKPLGSEVSLTEASQLKGGTTGYRIITITPAAAKPSTISYGGKTLTQGQTIKDEKGGTATVATKGNTITLNNFKGDKALVFNAEFTPNSITLIGDSTLSAVETKYQSLTISGSGSGSLTAGSIRVTNNYNIHADLTITGGAHVTVNRPSSEDEPAVEVSGNLTVTGDGTQLSAECTAATNPAIEVGGNVTISGNPGTNAYTVKAHNKYATQRGRDDKLRPSQMPLAIEISGDSLSISNSARVMAKTDSDGAAVWMSARKVISVVDASLIAQNSSHNFSTISFGDESDMGNIYAKGQVNIVAENMLHSSSSLAHRAIKAFIYNHYSTGDSNPYYINVVSEGVQSGGNVNVIPGHCTSTGGYKVTITRGDEVTRTNSPVVIAGTTLLNDTYYTINGSTVAVGTDENNYNAFYDSAKKTLKLNNAKISTTTNNAAIKIGEDAFATYTITVTGTNELQGNYNHCIESYSSFKINGDGTLEMTNGSNTTASVIYCGPDKSLTIGAEVIFKNNSNSGVLLGMVEKDAYSFAEGYNVYASTNVSGSPLEAYDAAKGSTYKYLRVTKENLAPTTPTPQTPFTIYGIPAQFVDGGMIATTGVTATSSNNINLPIDRVEWYTFTPGFRPDGSMDSVINKTKATGNFEAGKYYVVEIRFVQDLSPFESWDMKVSGWSDNDVSRQSVTARNDIEIYFLTPASAATHEHNWAENYDPVYHWKMCTYDGCTAIKDKAPHEWTGWWVDDYRPEVHAQRCNCGYLGSTHSTLKYVAINGEQHQKQCPVDGCDYKIESSTTAHVYAEGSNICTDCGYNKSAPCDHGNRAYTNNGDGTHKVTCKACGATIVEKQSHEFGPTGACIYCGATQSGGDPTPDNPGTIVIIRPAEEEKPAQQPNPSTGANDLVGLAVAAAVAAALGSAALLRKHD